MINSIPIVSFGQGFIELEQGDFNVGQYTITLKVDEKLIQTQKIIVIK